MKKKLGQKEEPEQPLVSIIQARGGTAVICINYSAGLKGWQLNRALESCKEQFLTHQPMIIVCEEKCPPEWVVPMVLVRLKHATRIAVDTRKGYPKSCIVIYVRDGFGSPGKWIKNPCPKWRALDTNRTHSDRKK